MRFNLQNERFCGENVQIEELGDFKKFILQNARLGGYMMHFADQKIIESTI